MIPRAALILTMGATALISCPGGNYAAELDATIAQMHASQEAATDACQYKTAVKLQADIIDKQITRWCNGAFGDEDQCTYWKNQHAPSADQERNGCPDGYACDGKGTCDLALKAPV